MTCTMKNAAFSCDRRAKQKVKRTLVVDKICHGVPDMNIYTGKVEKK